MKGGGQVLNNSLSSQQNNTSILILLQKTTKSLTSGGEVPGSGPNKDTVPHVGTRVSLLLVGVQFKNMGQILLLL